MAVPHKQKFWYNFAGSDIDQNIWNEVIVASTPTFAMINEIDGGFGISTNATNERGLINFNDNKQFDFDNSVWIWTVKQDRTTDSQILTGGNFNANGIFTQAESYAYIGHDSGTNANYHVGTSDGTNQSTSIGSVASNTNFNVFRMTLDDTSVISFINSLTLDVTKTTNYPTERLQPQFQVMNRGSGTFIGSIKYLEVYNT